MKYREVVPSVYCGCSEKMPLKLQTPHLVFWFPRESLEKNPLWFSLQEGKVTALCPQEGEQVWALNIKRAILSMLQTSHSVGTRVMVEEVRTPGSAMGSKHMCSVLLESNLSIVLWSHCHSWSKPWNWCIIGLSHFYIHCVLWTWSWSRCLIEWRKIKLKKHWDLNIKSSHQLLLLSFYLSLIQTDVYGTCMSRYERRGSVLVKARSLQQCHQRRMSEFWQHSVALKENNVSHWEVS